MKISEIKERKVIHRPTLDFDRYGKRIYHAYEYYLPYNPGFKGNETQRLFAKWIDLALFSVLFYYLFNEKLLMSIAISIPVVIISGAITESYFGTTSGKKIFRMKVIDDEGKYPAFLHSLKRNFLCLANLFPIFTEYSSRTALGSNTGIHMNFRMYLNNKICTTYVVKESKMEEIRSLLDVDQPRNNNQINS
ncbi:RDD family protein [Chryseobacterium profundimaris]|uniref:RDD family protein n=1 Tax=Chryseobacterium profundimaris TaxID=1387275 RepID=A0ABY1NJM8_9FLAO|nr:RDD family protein [Chryseobacterium profundimaris]SMP10845.1 RDD family protein [Chryseobacterium profundimaris]